MIDRPNQPGPTRPKVAAAAPAGKSAGDGDFLHALASQAVDSMLDDRGDIPAAYPHPGHNEEDLKGVLSPEDLELLLSVKPAAPAPPTTGARVFSEDELQSLLKQAAADAEALTASLLGAREEDEEDGDDIAPAAKPNTKADATDSAPAAAGAADDEENANADSTDAADATDEELAELLAGMVDPSGKPFLAPAQPAAPSDAAAPANTPAAKQNGDDAEPVQTQLNAAPAAANDSVPASSAAKSPDETLTREDLDLLLAAASRAAPPPAPGEGPMAAPPPGTKSGEKAGADAPLVIELSQLDELLASRAEHKTADADAASDLPAAPHEIEPEPQAAPEAPAAPADSSPAAQAPAEGAAARPGMPPMFVNRQGGAGAPAAPAAEAAGEHDVAAELAADGAGVASDANLAPTQLALGPTSEPSALMRTLFIAMCILNRPFEGLSARTKSIAAFAAAALLMWAIFMFLLSMAIHRG
jgi:hypothetical protein